MKLLKAFATGPDAPLLTDGAAIDAAYRRHRFRVMVAITLGYGVAYTGRLALNVVKKPLIDGGIFSPSELGTIGSALFYAYAGGKLVNGFLADHTNARRFLFVGYLLAGLANLGMGFSTSLVASAMLWAMAGWFQSYGAPGSVVAMTSWFSNRERGRYYGIWSTAHSIGEGLTFAVVSSIAAWFGWRFGFWAPAAACALVAVGTLFWVQDRPRTMGLPAVAEWKNDYWNAPPGSDKSLFATQLSILKIPAVWVLAVASALTYVTRYAINSWGILYLQEARGYSLQAAGAMLTASTFAGIAGAIAFGYISDKFFAARRPPVNLLFALVEIAGLVLIFYGPQTTAMTVAGLLLFGLGLTGLVTSVGGLFAVDICPKRVAGAAMGMIGVFSYLGAAIQDQISGALIEKGMTTDAAGVHHYDFNSAISFWVGASILSALLAATLWRAKLRD